MRYLKQRDHFRCGPIALHNAHVWHGSAKPSKVSIPKLQKLCKCEGDPRNPNKFGTLPEDLTKAIKRTIHSKAKRKKKPSIKDIDEALIAGNSLIYQFYHDRHEGIQGHYALIIKRSSTGKTFTVVNYFSNEQSVQIMRRKTLIRDNNFDKHSSAMWVIPPATN